MATINGTANSDIITPWSISIGVDGFPTNANDTIYGLDGEDYIDGGSGSDVIYGGDGFDNLNGGDGDDFLYADGEGFVYGGAGNDFLDGELFYEPASGGVIINMSYSDQTVDGMLVLARTAIDEFGDTDTFSASVQFGHSSQYDDVVFGSDVGSFFFLRAGDDVMYAGGGDDLIYAGSGNDILDGGAGDFDTVSYYDDGYDLAGPATSGVVVDLQSGTATDGWGDSDLLTNFESVEGSNLSDDISGDANNNYLSGLDGNDVLSGRAGADFLYGGSGDDFIDGGSGNDVIHGGDGNDQIYGGDGNDVITDGNIGDSDNDDYIDAGAGDDTIINNGGTDTFIGGEGSDTLVTDVTTLPSDYTLLFDTVAGVHGRLEASPFPNDTIDGIENFTLIGSWDSQVTGGDEANRFQTDLGDDVISSGAGDDTILSGGGNDILDGGGGGFDTVSYYYDAYYGSTTPATSGVVVDLQSGTATDGWGYLDLVTNFEAVEGSNLADDISGDNNNNYLSGFDGNDSLSGRAGADFLDGGSGNDELTGGKGVDTFMFADGYGHDVILDLETSKVPASASGRLPPIVNTGLGDNNAALGDNIDMTGLTAVEEFQDVLDAASQVGNDVVMTFGADVLTLENFALSGLYDDMFIF